MSEATIPQSDNPIGHTDDTVIYEVTKREYVNGAGARVTYEERVPVLDPKRAESRWVGHVVVTQEGPGGQQMKREGTVELSATTPQTAFMRLREAVEILKKQAETAGKPSIIVPSSSEIGKRAVEDLAEVNARVRQPVMGSGRHE